MSGSVEVCRPHGSPLSDRTPIIQLPPPFANTAGFALQEISRYDDRGPAWYWNNFSAGEHVGTHFDAPVHWVTGQDGLDVSQVPAAQLVAPAVVIDKSAECAKDPDYLLEVDDVRTWESEHGPLPANGMAALPDRLGRPLRRPAGLPQRERDRAAHPWHLGRVRPLARRGVAGVPASASRPSAPTPARPHSFDPPFPCHSFLLGAGKLGLTQLQNVARLPATGAGADGRAAADRRRVRKPDSRAGARRAVLMLVAEAVGRSLAALGVRTVFGVVGSGNFHVTNALVAGGARFVAARHEGGAATMADAYARVAAEVSAVTVHQGCGLTNAMTGITEAAKSRTPMLVLAAAATAPRSNFFIDQRALCEAVGAVVETVPRVPLER
jgi:kynurenine formamidase